MRILLTNISLNGRTGTVIVTRDLALGLLRRGHEPSVYTLELGEVASELRSAGVPVTDDIGSLAGPVDLIHAHHLPTAAAAVARFPTAPAVFVCHDFTAWHDAPPALPSIRKFVVVSDLNARRLTHEHGVDPARIRLVLNGVDTERFQIGGALPEKPGRALAFARTPALVAPIQEACARRGVQVDVVGYGADRVLQRPEDLVPAYDLVFASGVTALEAMSCLRPVISCDQRGLAGFVDEARYAAWRPGNFGLRTLTRRNTAEALATEIDLYDARAAERVGSRCREEAALPRWIEAYERIYAEAVAEEGPAAAEIARGLAVHVQTWGPRLNGLWPWMVERGQLLAERDKLLSGLEPVPIGERLAFGTEGGAGPFSMLAGFHPEEPDGVWSRTATCGIRLRVPTGADLKIELELRTVVAPSEPVITLAVFGNGAPLDTWTFEGGDYGGRRAVQAPAALLDSGELHLGLRTSLVMSPAQSVGGTDTRPLGVRLQSIRIDPSPKAGPA